MLDFIDSQPLIRCQYWLLKAFVKCSTSKGLKTGTGVTLCLRVSHENLIYEPCFCFIILPWAWSVLRWTSALLWEIPISFARPIAFFLLNSFGRAPNDFFMFGRRCTTCFWYSLELLKKIIKKHFWIRNSWCINCNCSCFCLWCWSPMKKLLCS